MDAATELNRLRWRCSRRALREMDILLGNFLDKEYSRLTPDQAAAFSTLADLEDHDLWQLIMGKRECADAVQAEVVALLREARVK